MVLLCGGKGSWLAGATDEKPRCVCERTAMEEGIMAFRQFVTEHRYVKRGVITAAVRGKSIPFALS